MTVDIVRSARGHFAVGKKTAGRTKIRTWGHMGTNKCTITELSSSINNMTSGIAAFYDHWFLNEFRN